MRARVAASLSLAVCLVFASAQVSAQPCVCPALRPPTVALAESDAVFQGQVTGARDGPYVTGTSVGAPGRWITLLVLREWKGATAGTTRYVFTPTLCGVAFESGTAWVVYARHAGSNHDLRTTLCNRTRPVADAREDLVALGIPGTQIPEPAVAEGPAHAAITRGGRPVAQVAVRRGGRRVIRRNRRGPAHRVIRRRVIRRRVIRRGVRRR